MNEQSIKSIRNTMIITNIVILLMGVAFIAWPKESSEMLARVIGIVLLVCAGIEILRFVFTRTKGFFDIVFMVFGAILAVAGIWFVINPGWLVNLFGMIFGVIILIVGLMHLYQSVFIIRMNRQIWWVSLLIAIVLIGLGVLIITNPMGLTNGIMVLIGITMVLEAIAGFFNLPAIKYKVVEIEDF